MLNYYTLYSILKTLLYSGINTIAYYKEEIEEITVETVFAE